MYSFYMTVETKIPNSMGHSNCRRHKKTTQPDLINQQNDFIENVCKNSGFVTSTCLRSR